MTDKRPDWDAIRIAYETTNESIDQLAKRLGTYRQAVSARAKRDAWKPRNPRKAGDRQSLINRLMKMLERQIAYLEETMKNSDEKEVALLGNMARTLEKLIDLDNKVAGAKPDKKRDRDLEDIKRKLAARIDQLRKS